ncbi:MAG: transposase, partial [archaeon]|nr:transposase [archaeon]
FGFLSHVNFELYDIDDDGVRKRYLNLRKIGDVRARNLQEFPPGAPKTCHIKRERKGGHFEYFATVNYEIEGRYEKDEISLEWYHRSPQGMDIGIAKVATLSDGTEYQNKNFQKEDRELAKLHRRLSKCPRNSPEFTKIREKISHHYAKIKNRRTNETNVISKEIVYNNGQIFAENLSVDQLREIAYSHNMRQQYNDANLGKLMRRVEKLSAAANRPIIYVSHEYSSQTCSNCGTLVSKKLEERIHHCPNCGLTLDRDQNAAINLLNWGLARNPSIMEKNSISCTWLEPSSEYTY